MRPIDILPLHRILKLVKKHASFSSLLFAKALVVAMAVLVALPCSAKRSIKKDVGIPVAEMHHTDQPNKTSVCNATEDTKEAAAPAPGLAEALGAPLLERVDYRHRPFSAHGPSAIPNPRELPFAVPIHLLFEQFLI